MIKIRTKLAFTAFLFAIALPANSDQVFQDDVIIDGSACIGFDCVNGESFGFDTIRLKENNLRIRAFDTSTSASFPTRDWQITFNETSNGGANKFSIDDIDGGRTPFTIEAGTPSHSLYVEDGGRIGLGTNTPVVQLHVKDGNTPTLRLEQDGTSGFTPQTWDVAGNEANFFIRDASNGSTLPFRIFPGSPSNALTIDASGNVGVGTTTPDGSGGRKVEIEDSSKTVSLTLDHKGGAGSFGELLFQEANVDRWSIGSVGGTDSFYIYNYGSSVNLLTLDNATGYLGLGGVDTATDPIQHMNGAVLTAAGVWQSVSSRAAKQDINPLSGGAARQALSELEPVSFRYIADPSDEVVGFIAEDVPDLVATESRKTLSSIDIVAVLTKVVQEQGAAITQLEKEVATLQQPN